MKNILIELYNSFYKKPKNIPQEQRITSNHMLLINRLSKRDRKLVLRIIDDKDQICDDISLDSFIKGLLLGTRIANGIINESDGIM